MQTTPITQDGQREPIFGVAAEANLQEGPTEIIPKFKAVNFKLVPSSNEKRDWDTLLDDFEKQRN